MIRSVLTGAIATLVVSGPPVYAQDQPVQGRTRTTIAPYIEASQVLDADLNSGDVVTYTSLAVGVDAAITTPRTTGQLSYRYERRFGEGHRIGDADVHTGLARIDARVAQGLTLEGGAIATRARSDIRGAAPGILSGNVDNISQISALYGGPSYTTHSGPVGITADYRAGYTKVNVPTYAGDVQGRRLDYYDHSLGQIASASAGFRPGTVLPVGLTVSGAYDREDASQLSQRYEGYYGRGDALLPVSPTLALTAGVGYERIVTSQKDALLNSNGNPVTDSAGRFVTAPDSPRRIAYRTAGVYYDAGVVWRPNHRTSVEARIGRRYGSLSYTGTATYQASRDVGFAVNVYDGIQTFGRQLRTGLANLPTSFVGSGGQFGQQFNGCVFGTTGAAPGGCLNDVFQSISTASYRARGVDAVMAARRGVSTFGIGMGYANRRLFAPDVPSGVTIYDQEDESYYGQLFYGRSLSRVSGVDVTAFVNYYASDLPGTDGTWSYGGTAAYYHYFGRLGTTASLGLYSFRVGDFDSDLTAQALIGARYQF